MPRSLLAESYRGKQEKMNSYVTYADQGSLYDRFIVHLEVMCGLGSIVPDRTELFYEAKVCVIYSKLRIKFYFKHFNLLELKLRDSFL